MVKTYRDMLSQELNRRRQRNPAYSMRSFARDLGLSASKLSEILRGHRGLSLRRAEKTLQQVKWSSTEKSFFLNSVTAMHSRSPSVREQAQDLLQTQMQEMTLDRFQLVTDWYHLAFLEVLETQDAPSTVQAFAERFNISEELSQAALDRLIKLKWLQRSGRKWKSQHIHMATPTDIPSSSLREHHLQLLTKAEDALEAVDVLERDFSALHLAFDTSEMSEVKKFIHNFRREFNAKFSKSRRKDRVYCLAVQWFPLDQKKQRRGT